MAEVPTHRRARVLSSKCQSLLAAVVTVITPKLFVSAMGFVCQRPSQAGLGYTLDYGLGLGLGVLSGGWKD